MIFNSASFLVFLFVVCTLYWVLPRRARLLLLFASSVTFYGFWRVEFVPLMLVSAITDYVVSRRLGVTDDPARRKVLLGISLVVNLGLLFYFKYLLFFAGNVAAAASWVGLDWSAPEWKIILPLGISFYTFQTISYTVDVYRRVIEPKRDFLLYADYVTYFPQLVAGPILRASEVLGQLDRRPRFSLVDIGTGLRRVLYGLFLKVVIADNIAPLVDNAFSQATESLSALDVWTLAFLFGFQIYFDFSAYSHVALGAARMMGIRFPENFDFPYIAASPREFWRRWHISLSSWIRDYLYLPLARERFRVKSTGGLETAAADNGAEAKRSGRRTRALFLTWAIMGLWHGANWTFVLWGLWHATLVFGYRLAAPGLAPLPAWLRRIGGWAITVPLVMLGWIAFRAEDLGQAGALYIKLVSLSDYTWLGMRENTYLVTALLFVAITAAHFVRRGVRWLREKQPWPVAVADVGVFAVVSVLVFVFLRPISQFIYFQF